MIVITKNSLSKDGHQILNMIFEKMHVKSNVELVSKVQLDSKVKLDSNFRNNIANAKNPIVIS